MSRGRRWLLIVSGILVALLVAIAITLAVLLRPASLKARIEREVRAATGFVLHLDGEVQWQAWPEPKLTLGAARVEAPGTGGAATAGAAPLAQWRLLAAEAHWRPLLHGERRLSSLRSPAWNSRWCAAPTARSGGLSSSPRRARPGPRAHWRSSGSRCATARCG
jgi:uncharacterized protein involved in outer membrane biogenesis